MFLNLTNRNRRALANPKVEPTVLQFFNRRNSTERRCADELGGRPWLSSSRSPCGWGFPHRARRYQPEGPPSSSPVRRSCRGMKRLMIRQRDPIPRMTLAPRAPTNERSACGVGCFRTVRDGIDPMNHRFRAQCVGLVDVWKNV